VEGKGEVAGFVVEEEEDGEGEGEGEEEERGKGEGGEALWVKWAGVS